jgi:hypothetical protein
VVTSEIQCCAGLDEPFLLVVVGEFNSGKSSVVNALLGSPFLEEGILPTTNEISILKHSESVSSVERVHSALLTALLYCQPAAPAPKSCTSLLIIAKCPHWASVACSLTVDSRSLPLAPTG